MHILTLSDLHLGKWDGFAEACIEEARRVAEAQQPEVLLLGGDLVEPGAGRLEAVLERIAAVPVAHRLWVVGNNDLEVLPGPLSDYAAQAARLAAPYGVQVLDAAPQVIDGVGFVGNLGAFDGSLWRGGEAERARRAAEAEVGAVALFGARLDCTNQALFEACQARLRADLARVQAQRVVLMTHTSPSSTMCLYGHSERYDGLNWFMGWDDAACEAPLEDPRIVLKLCGHTHRFKARLGSGAPLINVSGRGQPRLFEV